MRLTALVAVTAASAAAVHLPGSQPNEYGEKSHRRLGSLRVPAASLLPRPAFGHTSTRAWRKLRRHGGTRVARPCGAQQALALSLAAAAVVRARETTTTATSPGGGNLPAPPLAADARDRLADDARWDGVISSVPGVTARAGCHTAPAPGAAPWELPLPEDARTWPCAAGAGYRAAHRASVPCLSLPPRRWALISSGCCALLLAGSCL
jgi:hypothetical protein